MIIQQELQTLQQELAIKLNNKIPHIKVEAGASFTQLFARLEASLITVGVQNIQVQSAGFSDHFGISAGDEFTSDIGGKWCQVTFVATLFLPYDAYEEMSLGSNDQNDANLFLTSCQELLFDTDLSLEQLTAKELFFDEKLQAFVLELQLVGQSILVKTNLQTPINTVTLRTNN